MTPQDFLAPSARPAWTGALSAVHRLTAREREVFALLAEGGTNQELADRLFVTERTVRAHLAQILDKLGLSSRLQACLASYAWRCEPSGPPLVRD